MSDLNLENIVGFKAVDKNGNERQVTVDEMTELVSARIVSAASEISTFAAAAAAGTDEFEDQLPQSDTFSWLRTLDGSKLLSAGGDGSKNPTTLTSSFSACREKSWENFCHFRQILIKGLTRRTAYFDLIQGKLYKIAYKEELYVYKPVICLLYVLRNGISSCYVASLSGYRNGVSHFKLICGNDIQFKLYQKLNSANYFDIMLECPDNSAGIMEIKAMDDLTVIETTEPLRDWQQIATE